MTPCWPCRQPYLLSFTNLDGPLPGRERPLRCVALPPRLRGCLPGSRRAQAAAPRKGSLHMGPPQQQLAKPWCPGARGAPRKVLGAAAFCCGKGGRAKQKAHAAAQTLHAFLRDVCVTSQLDVPGSRHFCEALGAAPRGRASIRVLGKTSGRGTQEAAVHNQVGGHKHFEGRRERPRGGGPGFGTRREAEKRGGLWGRHLRFGITLRGKDAASGTLEEQLPPAGSPKAANATLVS